MPCLLDADLEVSEDLWMVALVHKSKKDNNPEHSFILVEGKSDQQRTTLRRYDLTRSQDANKKYDVGIQEEDVHDAMARKTLLDKFLKGDVVQIKSWQMSKSKADELHANMMDASQDPDRVLKTLGGVSSVSQACADSDAKVAEALGSEPGSSPFAQGVFSQKRRDSFSWSRSMLQALKVPSVNRDLPQSAEELITSLTDRLQAQESFSHGVSKSGGSGCHLM